MSFMVHKSILRNVNCALNFRKFISEEPEVEYEKRNFLCVSAVTSHCRQLYLFNTTWEYTPERSPSVVPSVQSPLSSLALFDAIWKCTLARNPSNVHSVLKHLLNRSTCANISWVFTWVRDPTAVRYVQSRLISLVTCSSIWKVTMARKNPTPVTSAPSHFLHRSPFNITFECTPVRNPSAVLSVQSPLRNPALWSDTLKFTVVINSMVFTKAYSKTTCPEHLAKKVHNVPTF